MGENRLSEIRNLQKHTMFSYSNCALNNLLKEYFSPIFLCFSHHIINRMFFLTHYFDEKMYTVYWHQTRAQSGKIKLSQQLTREFRELKSSRRWILSISLTIAGHIRKTYSEAKFYLVSSHQLGLCNHATINQVQRILNTIEKQI